MVSLFWSPFVSYLQASTPLAVDEMDSVVYPAGREAELRTLSTGLSLLGTTIISYCFAQRAYHLDFSSFNGLSSMKATNWILILLFLDSWAFVFLSGLLVNGVGMSLSPATCSMGIFSCIIFYCASKFLTYLFLLEKVYIVWPNNGTRMSSTAYKVGFTAMLGFVVVVIMMFIGRIAYIRNDHQCVIGLHKASSMTTLLVDLGVNIILTSMFLWPLWRSDFLSINIRRVASRTLVASFCALTISVTNLAILTVLHGQELAWICLSSCSTDVLVNALVLFWLTRPNHDGEEQPKSSITAPRQIRHISINGASATIGRQHGGYLGKQNLEASEAAASKSTGYANENTNAGPVKVDFEQGYSGVYDGSRSYMRNDQVSSPTSAQPLQANYPPSGHQRRSSIGFAHAAPAPRSPERTSFFDRFWARSTNDTAKMGGLRSVGGVGGGRMKKGKRGRDGEDGNMEVRITVTTHLENDMDVYEDVMKESGRSNSSV